MKRSTSGLTLLEVLLAVALLASVVTGTSWFLRTATKRALTTSATIDERAAVAALFAAIERDLLIGDADGEVVVGRPGRVAANANGCLIATRSTSTSVGAVVREYTWRASTQEVLSAERPRRGTSGSSEAVATPSVVLGSVTRFESSLDPKAHTLSVIVELANRKSLTREWRLP